LMFLWMFVFDLCLVPYVWCFSECLSSICVLCPMFDVSLNVCLRSVSCALCLMFLWMFVFDLCLVPYVWCFSECLSTICALCPMFDVSLNVCLRSVSCALCLMFEHSPKNIKLETTFYEFCRITFCFITQRP
jgi:hypothetical protein